MGRLVREPEIRQAGENKVASFTLAVDRKVARNEGAVTADFIGIEAWNKRAEFAERYLHQGTKVVLSGRITTGSYTNKDGNKVYTTSVVAEELEFAESKKSNGGDDGFSKINAPIETEEQSFTDVPYDGDLPFAPVSR